MTEVQITDWPCKTPRTVLSITGQTQKDPLTGAALLALKTAEDW